MIRKHQTHLDSMDPLLLSYTKRIGCFTGVCIIVLSSFSLRQYHRRNPWVVYGMVVRKK